MGGLTANVNVNVVYALKQTVLRGSPGRMTWSECRQLIGAVLHSSADITLVNNVNRVFNILNGFNL